MPELKDILAALEEASRRRTFRKIDFFKPYPKQEVFFAEGQTHRERLLMAGNQVGKTYCGAAELTYHLTGEYPDAWQGKVFTGPVRAWACGKTALVVRDVQQKLLFGEPGVEQAFGTGMVPRERIVERPSLARGVTDAYDTVQIEHRTKNRPDGISILRFKSYEQGREKLQGETIHYAWLDEEPEEAIYSEILTRTTATSGIIAMTFTPLLGMSAVVKRFISPASDDAGAPFRAVTNMTIDDAQHIPLEERERIVAGWPEHEREARRNGTPMLGSGLIYQVADSAIMEPALEYIPPHWVKLWGVDFGVDHPFAAALILWDRDNDVIHLHHTIRIRGQFPINHAAAIKPVAAAVPVAWPHDGHKRDLGSDSGDTLASIYKKHGLHMLGSHTTWPEGGYSVEAGIMELQERMRSGRFKVASHLSEWFEEKRLYHRKDGLIVKEGDDLLDATRMAIMGKRYARAVPLGPDGSGSRRRQHFAKGVDFDPF